MAIFSKNNKRSISSSETTLISQGANIKGEFSFDSRLHVDGEIEGKIVSKNTVVIGKKGIIRGDLQAEKLVVNGKFEGVADCKTVEVLVGGTFTGDVISEDLMIESKAHFEGKSNIRIESESSAEEPKEYKAEETE